MAGQPSAENKKGSDDKVRTRMAWVLGHPRRLAVVFVMAALAIGGVWAVSATATTNDTKDCSIEVADRLGYEHCTTNANATVEYLGDSNTTFGSSGTGTFNSFVRVQGTPTEQGYNTNGTLQYDTKSGNWMKAILVSGIPVTYLESAPEARYPTPVTTGSMWPCGDVAPTK